MKSLRGMLFLVCLVTLVSSSIVQSPATSKPARQKVQDPAGPATKGVTCPSKRCVKRPIA